MDRTLGPIRKRPSQPAFDPSAAGAWATVNTGGTIQASYNVSSASRTAEANYTVNWRRDFSSNSYCVCAQVHVSASVDLMALVASQNAGDVQIFIVDQAGTLTEVNVADWSVAAHGELL